MREAIDFLCEMKPRAFVLENVLGFGDIPAGQDKSALQLVFERLQSAGYQMIALEIDLKAWTTVARPRHPFGPQFEQRIRFGCGGFGRVEKYVAGTRFRKGTSQPRQDRPPSIREMQA